MRSSRRWVTTMALIAVVGFVVGGCASIMHGTKQRISITSTPEEATVKITTSGGISMFTGSTPASASLKRKHDYIVTISLSGYETKTMMIDKTFDSWTIGNLLCGGILGLIIDATNGAMYKLEPEMIHVELVQANLEDGSTSIYAVLRGVDSNGDLRTLVIPMIKKAAFVAS